MKKKVIFDKPTDVVGIEEINPNGFFLAEKNGYSAILLSNGIWVSTEGLGELPYMSAGNQRESIVKAYGEGCTIYQYSSFYELCKDYISED